MHVRAQVAVSAGKAGVGSRIESLGRFCFADGDSQGIASFSSSPSSLRPLSVKRLWEYETVAVYCLGSFAAPLNAPLFELLNRPLAPIKRF